MIRNGFFKRGQGAKQIGFAPPIVFLPAALIFASFRTAGVSEASAAELGEAGFETAGEAAIPLSAVAVRTDKYVLSCSVTHAFGAAEAIELARALARLPLSLVVYGIEVKSFAAGAGLSAEVEKAASEITRQLFIEFNP